MTAKKKYTGIELMGEAPVGKAIVSLALPMMLTMLVQSIYNMTDMFFIGQTGDPNMVAAIALVNPLFMLSQALGNVFATGGSSYISRLLGAGKNDEARQSSTVSLYIAFVIGLFMTAIISIFKAPILRLIGASDVTFEYTNGYFTPLLLFIAFAASSSVMSGQMRSEGAAKKAMTLQIMGIVLNIILDPIFILWFNMGTAGAAWATVAGQFASFVYGIRYYLSKDTLLSVRPNDYKPNKEMMKQMLSIGIPAALTNVVMSVTSILSNRILAGFGDHVIAGAGVHMRVTSMFFMVLFALIMGYQPFAGFNYGAKNFDRLKKGFKLTLLVAWALSIIGAAVLRFAGASLIRFFIDDEQTIAAGVAIMSIFVYGVPLIPPQIMLMVSFQAFGKPLQATIITLGRQCLFYIPMLFVLTHMFGFDGFVWVQPTADVLTTGIAAVLGISLFKSFREQPAQ